MKENNKNIKFQKNKKIIKYSVIYVEVVKKYILTNMEIGCRPVLTVKKYKNKIKKKQQNRLEK